MLYLAVQSMQNAHSEQENMTEIPRNCLVIVFERFGFPGYGLNITIEWNKIRSLD